MKKTLLLLMAAFAATSMSATDYVLDLSAPTYPEEINFIQKGNGQIWSDTYNEDEYILNYTPFIFYHLMSGMSYGGTYWDGFTVVKCGDNSKQTDFVTNQWGNMAGGGIDPNIQSAVVANPNVPYMLAYVPDFMGPGLAGVEFDDDNTYMAKGVYVNMSAYAYYSCLEGDAMSEGLKEEGASFKLQAIGKLGNESKTVEIELAGFSNGKFHALTDWTWFDMTELGEVEKIYFSLTSTDASQWGMNTPAYFAMDKFTVSDKSEPTGVNDVNDKAVASVKYVNVAGQVSDTAFDGVNVKVTTYTDGSTKSVKVMK
ncbi:MAG: DUF4465 domain-containing protein [Muribaculaceae bacterium]|nr:DUF4465 domain-containing protein [Muribaculaceae bacterium]